MFSHTQGVRTLPGMHCDHVLRMFLCALEEIYFKSIIPAVIYGIVVWGNCSSAMLNSLNPIHERAARLIHDQDDLQSLNWLPLSYLYNRRLLLFMFDVIKHNVPDDLASLFTLKSGSRPSRRGSQFVIPRII